MDRQLGQDLSQAKRTMMLRDNCDTTEEVGYMKPFSVDEVSTMKDELSETAISIDDIETKKKEVMTQFKEDMSPLKGQKSRLLKLIKNKSEFVKEVCFKFIAFDEKMVGYYNSEGLLIEARPMRPEEAQRTIQISKTGTND